MDAADEAAFEAVTSSLESKWGLKRTSSTPRPVPTLPPPDEGDVLGCVSSALSLAASRQPGLADGWRTPCSPPPGARSDVVASLAQVTEDARGAAGT